MKNVLILTDINFWEGYSGDRARLRTLVTYLAPKVNLTVVNTGPDRHDVEEYVAQTFSIESHVLEKKEILDSNAYGRRLKKLLKGRKFDTVIIEYIHSSYFLNFLEGEPQLILDVHDIVSERAQEFKKFNYGGALYEVKTETELEILKVYDYVMAICAPDKEKLDTLLDPDFVLLCPHSVPVINHHLADKVKAIAFVASMYLPNKDAITYFIENCWPKLTDKYPELQLHIYGTICYSLNAAIHPNVILKGFVNDINDIYDSADIMISPVRFGAGMKIKNIEALAHGIPLVTTTHGARGFEPQINKGFLLADTPDEFVSAVVSLIENKQLREKIKKNSQEFIAQYFSPDACFSPLLKVIAAY